MRRKELYQLFSSSKVFALLIYTNILFYKIYYGRPARGQKVPLGASAVKITTKPRGISFIHTDGEPMLSRSTHDQTSVILLRFQLV